MMYGLSGICYQSSFHIKKNAKSRLNTVKIIAKTEMHMYLRENPYLPEFHLCFHLWFLYTLVESFVRWMIALN